ncbi:MAG: hypothetical protein ABL871_09715 [Terricaulis sp.]
MPTSARDQFIAMSAAVLVGAGLSYAFMSARLPQSIFGPMLFGLPLALTLLWLGRLRWVGALYLALAIAAAYYAAIFASIAAYSQVNANFCPSCIADETARTAHVIRNDQIIGAAGGAVGAFLSFLAAALLGQKLRDGHALILMAIGVALLALIGAFGFSGSLIGGQERLITPDGGAGNYLQGFALFVTWQLVFGGLLIALFRRHTPRAKA